MMGLRGLAWVQREPPMPNWGKIAHALLWLCYALVMLCFGHALLWSCFGKRILKRK